jgi:hypothetical protein
MSIIDLLGDDDDIDQAIVQDYLDRHGVCSDENS